MDRYVILIDAGYLYAATGELCCRTSNRRDLDLDPERINHFLRDRCGNHCDQAHLRTYWYDGAPEALATMDQLRFGEQQGVKLRLGRLTKHGQKGVDSRIVRDLIVLPRNGAVSTIYLMSGDEDVREGVLEAQELGVLVVLLGVEPLPGKANQAATLVREADDLIVLSRSDCLKFITRRQDDTAAAPLAGTIAVDVEEGLSAREFGHALGATFRAEREPQAIEQLLLGKPNIPRHLDGWLLRTGASRFTDPMEEAMRRSIRAGFWEGLQMGSSDSGADEDSSEPDTTD